MKFLPFSLLLLCFTFSTTVHSQSITYNNVERIISTLASDSLQGRKTFTPSIEKAADFISSEFEKIGVEPLSNEDSFVQHFTIYSLVPQQAKLVINGTTVDKENYFVWTDATEVQWTALAGKKIYHITEDHNFQQQLREINRKNGDAIIFIDDSHKDFFTKKIKLMDYGRGTVSINDKGTKVYLLMDNKKLESGSLSFTNKVTASTTRAFNVAAQITGKSRADEYVVFSAHYDHFGIVAPVEGDSIANGADDNASGTTAVLSLAKYYKKLGPQERTLIFVAFTAEEFSGYGSEYFSRQLNPDQVVAMFNIEMIGKPSKFGPNSAFITGFEKSSMGNILQKSLEDTPYEIHPDPYPEQNLFYRSDNATLARLGVPAHSLSSVQIDTDPYYHTVDDELETLDMEHLTNLIKAIALSSRSIASGEETPSRIDISAVNRH